MNARHFIEVVVAPVVVGAVFLAAMPLVSPSQPACASDYNRKEWSHWVDTDRDCQDARQEAFIQQSITDVVLDSRGCKVISGEWYDPFTGLTFTDPRKMDIDHFVPLGNAHISGASRWDKNKKRAYANHLKDHEHLIAVQSSANRAKGSRSPDQWMPPNKAFHCQYVLTWKLIKATWGLSMTDAEYLFVNNKIKECGQ